MVGHTSRFDFTDFYEEGFEKTESLEQAIYVFQDGTLWSGYSEGGDGYTRDVDHGSIEAFLIDGTIDRYHPDFHSLKLEEMIQIVPETRTVLTLIDNHYSQEQIDVLHQLEEENFTIEQLENTLVESEEIDFEKHHESSYEEKPSESFLYDIDIVEENQEIVQAYNKFLKAIQSEEKAKSESEERQIDGLIHEY